jgi:predicted TIM-barrel fold metal-dependent hydrolase
VNFLIAHVGNPDMKAAANVVSKNENVFADSSGLLVGDLDHMAPETVNRLVVEPLKFFWDWVGDPNKLLFGTDWPLLNLPQWLALHKKIIPEKDQRKVFCENALTFFKLDPKELKPITGP